MKTAKSARIFLILGVLALLVMAPLSPSNASPVPDAQFSGFLNWPYNPTISINNKGTTECNFTKQFVNWIWDDNLETWVEVITTAYFAGSVNLTPGVNPKVVMTGSGNDVGGQTGAAGQITYYLQVNKLNPSAPDTVPLLMSSSGYITLNYSAPTSLYGIVQSAFKKNPNQADYIYHYEGVQSGGGSNTIQENVTVGTSYAIVVYAYVYTTGSLDSWNFSALIDPMVQFDPSVTINGVPLNQLYSLTFSPGFNRVPLTTPNLLLLFD